MSNKICKKGCAFKAQQVSTSNECLSTSSAGYIVVEEEITKRKYGVLSPRYALEQHPKRSKRKAERRLLYDSQRVRLSFNDTEYRDVIRLSLAKGLRGEELETLMSNIVALAEDAMDKAGFRIVETTNNSRA